MDSDLGWRAKNVVAIAAVLLALRSFASTGPDPAAPSLTEVIVTGSRIPIASDIHTAPVTILDSNDLSRGGFDSLGKILQALPMSASSVMNTNVNNDGDGSQRLDLRALQPKRTLVLLNGNRFPNGGVGGDNSVDLDSIPLALIDRVEVLTSGASAIYGADAVAGVVNFITRSNYEGVEFGAQHSQADRGDGRIDSINLNVGHTLFGGQWMLGGEYVDQQPVSQLARAYSAVPLAIIDFQGDTMPVGSLNRPEGLFDVPAGNALGLDPGFYTRVSGTKGVNAVNFRPEAFDRDFYNPAPYNYLQTPNRREAIWLFGSQPLSTTVTMNVEGLFHHRRSTQVNAPTPYDSTFDPAPLLADGTHGIPADNYYNPFGKDLDLVYRRFVELPDREYTQDITMHRELVSLNIGVATWSIHPALSYSRSTATKTDGGSIPGDRLSTAVGPSGLDAQGNLVCGARDAGGIVPAAAIIPGCVPIDLFGGPGSLTPQQVGYLTVPLRDRGTNEERTASLDAQGPWGRLPGGDIRWAVGVEYRREAGDHTFDPNRGPGIVGSGGQSDIPPVAFSAREAYVELRAPLARQQRYVGSADFSAGLRRSEFSSFGGRFTWQAGLRWQAVPWWVMRTNYARVFRAPNLSELYTAQGAGSAGAFDPCGNDPTPNQRVNCAANGVPGGQYAQNPFASYHVTQGGNPNLAPESGYSFDAGIEIQPESLPGLRSTVDFYQIDLGHYIDTPGTGDVLQQCADGGRADICSLIQRAPDGTIVSVSAVPRNFGRVVVDGIDAAIHWTTAPRVGRLNVKLQTGYQARHDTQLFPGGATVREAGTYSTYAAALPRWRALAAVDWQHGPWHFDYGAQWIGGYRECNPTFFTQGSDLYCRAVRGVVYHDFDAAFAFRSGLTLRVGVSNLTDVQPPFLDFGTDANTDTSVYRLLGRTWYAAIRYRMR